MRLGRGLILLIAGLGALFCVLNASGAELLCLTQGCNIYAGYNLFGVPFYFYGMAAFLLILLLTLIYPRGRTELWLYYAVSFFLAADVLFLGYQYLYWTCSSCLAVALLLGLVALVGLSVFSWRERRLIRGLLLLWILLLTYNGLTAVKETAFAPTPLYGHQSAPYQIFFSPTCPACEDAVLRILNDSSLAEFTAFYPLIKSEKDEERLALYLHGEGDPGDVQTLRVLFQEPSDGDFSLKWRQKFNFMANKIALASKGVSTVPLFMGPDLPEVKEKQTASPSASPFAPGGELNLFSPPEGCSAAETADECD